MRKLINNLNFFALKVMRAIRRHGFTGLLFLVGERVARLINSFRPSVRAEILARNERAAEFDIHYGVDTAGLIHPTKLSIDYPNQLHAVSYRGSDPELFLKVIRTLPVDYRRFIFIDFGSGKGRAVLLAKEFPFKKIIGVEFSTELHSIAVKNLERFQSEKSMCDNVELICADAVEFPLPSECLICYFCNPFDATLMAQMLTNIQKSFSSNRREIFFVYYNPKEAQLFDSTDYLMSLKTIDSVRIWKTIL